MFVYIEGGGGGVNMRRTVNRFLRMKTPHGWHNNRVGNYEVALSSPANRLISYAISRKIHFIYAALI